MERLSLVIATALAVVGLVSAGSAAAVVAGPGGGTAQAESGDALAPGEQLGAVMGVQRAEIDGEVSTRAFGQRLARAETNASRAGVVAEETERLDERLARLETRKAELNRAFENGSMDRGEYNARMAQLRAEQRSVERLANATETTARGLPPQALEARGVNVTAIGHLRANARNLTGPEVAEMARSIAGPGAGNGLGPSGAGPPAFVGNRTGGPGMGGPPGGGGPPDDGDTGTPSDGGGAGPPGDAGPGGGGPPDESDARGPSDDGADNGTASGADADR